MVNPDKAKELCTSLGIDYVHDNSLFEDETLHSKLQQEVETINRNNAIYEAIKRPVFVFDKWNAANGLLSQTLKLKRKALMQKYQDVLNEKVYTV